MMMMMMTLRKNIIRGFWCTERVFVMSPAAAAHAGADNEKTCCWGRFRPTQTVTIRILKVTVRTDRTTENETASAANAYLYVIHIRCRTNEQHRVVTRASRARPGR